MRNHIQLKGVHNHRQHCLSFNLLFIILAEPKQHGLEYYSYLASFFHLKVLLIKQTCNEVHEPEIVFDIQAIF